MSWGALIHHVLHTQKWRLCLRSESPSSPSLWRDPPSSHQDHLLIPEQQRALTGPHSEHLHSKGQKPPRTQGNLCPLESESSAPGRVFGVFPKLLERLFWLLSGKPAGRPFPAEQSLTGRGERRESELERGRKEHHCRRPWQHMKQMKITFVSHDSSAEKPGGILSRVSLPAAPPSPSAQGSVSNTCLLGVSPGGAKDTRNPDNQTLRQELNSKGSSSPANNDFTFLGINYWPDAQREDPCAKMNTETKIGVWTQRVFPRQIKPVGLNSQAPDPQNPRKSSLASVWAEASLGSAPKTVCPQHITSRKVMPLGSIYLEVQLKYDHCLENSLFLSWQMSFLSVLNLKATHVLECLENITPHSHPQVITSANLKHFHSRYHTGSCFVQKKKLRQQLVEKWMKVKVLTSRDWDFQRWASWGQECVLSLSLRVSWHLALSRDSNKDMRN